MMEGWNAADLLGIIFLGLGAADGYRKGLVKKGMSLVATLGTLLAVYVVSPYVAHFFEALLPEAFFMDLGADGGSEIYRILILSGFGEEAGNYVRAFAARVLSMVVTYTAVRLILHTLVFSLEILVKVPGLSLLNRLSGAGFGLFQHLLLLWLVLLALLVLGNTGWGSGVCKAVQDSVLLGYLYENNPLLLVGILLILGI